MRAYEIISETRNKMFEYIKSILPKWPDYVLRDWIYNLAKGDHQVGAGFVKDDPSWGFNRETILKVIQDTGLSPDTKWQLVPDMKFTLDMFEPNSKRKLIGRAGGHSDMGMGIHRDKERHTTQAQLARQQGGVRKEPVILVKTDQGYELVEGWHRTIQHFAMYPKGYNGPAWVAVAQSQQGVIEGFGKDGYKEIEFICVNPKFPNATDPKLQKQMYIGLQQISGVIPLLQDQSDYSEGQYSLTAIYKGSESRSQILKLAKQLGVQVDLEQPVSDDYVDRAIRGEHEGQQGIAEGTADDINKMFGNMFDPNYAALQRVALLAMQGRQDEAMSHLSRVIKDINPNAQKKIMSAVNNIKPVTINGKIADSSTLDKSEQHQQWIKQTFIPWVESLL